MKKIIGVILSLAAVVTLSSFVIAHNGNNSTTFKQETLSVNDDGWEYYTTVTAYAYEKKSGEWVYTRVERKNLEVQRRMSCGEREFRIKYLQYGQPRWFTVSKSSPVDGYSYCFYESQNNWAMCFNM